MADIRRRKAAIASSFPNDSSRRSHHDHRLPSPLKRKGLGKGAIAILGHDCSKARKGPAKPGARILQFW